MTVRARMDLAKTESLDLPQAEPAKGGSVGAPRLTWMERAIVPAGVFLLLIGLPWLHPGYRLLSLAVSTGVNTIALCGLAILFGQARIAPA